AAAALFQLVSPCSDGRLASGVHAAVAVAACPWRGTGSDGQRPSMVRVVVVGQLMAAAAARLQLDRGAGRVGAVAAAIRVVEGTPCARLRSWPIARRG